MLLLVIAVSSVESGKRRNGRKSRKIKKIKLTDNCGLCKQGAKLIVERKKLMVKMNKDITACRQEPNDGDPIARLLSVKKMTRNKRKSKKGILYTPYFMKMLML